MCITTPYFAIKKVGHCNALLYLEYNFYISFQNNINYELYLLYSKGSQKLANYEFQLKFGRLRFTQIIEIH